MHAALGFAIAHPGLLARWHALSNTLVVLAAPGELELEWLCRKAAEPGLRVVRFNEPDLDGALTAAAFEPAARRLLAHLPLALSPRKEVRT